MRARAAVIPLLLFTSSAHADDPPFGADKALHFSVSVALAGGAYAASALLQQPVEARLATACGVSLMMGVLKELADTQGFGAPSSLDLAWDVAGTAVGAVLAWLVDRLITSRMPFDTPPSAAAQGARVDSRVDSPPATSWRENPAR